MDAGGRRATSCTDAPPPPVPDDGRGPGLVRDGRVGSVGQPLSADLTTTLAAAAPDRYRGIQASRARWDAHGSRARAGARGPRGARNGTSVHGSGCREPVGTTPPAPRASRRERRGRRHLAADTAPDLA